MNNNQGDLCMEWTKTQESKEKVVETHVLSHVDLSADRMVGEKLLIEEMKSSGFLPASPGA